MILGMTLLTAIHVALSLLGLVFGIPAILGLLGAPIAHRWTTTFFALAVATSVTGFLLPLSGVTPAVVTGIVALVVLAAVLAADRLYHFTGVWRRVYAIGIVASLYFIVFVTIAQAFGKIPALHATAPTLSEPPFAIAQVIALVAFVVLGVIATRRFHPVTVA